MEVLSEKGEFEPSPRFGHTCNVIEKKMYLFGGWNGLNTLNDIWVLDLEKKSWKELENSCPFGSRYRHSAVGYRNEIFIFGGIDKLQVNLKLKRLLIIKNKYGDLISFSILNNSWTKVNKIENSSPSPRSFHTSVVSKGIMYVIGGENKIINQFSKEIAFFLKIL